MTTTLIRSPQTQPTATRHHASTTGYAVLMGLCTLAVLLQGLWAGIFLGPDRKGSASDSWVEVHARGGEVALGLAAIATIVAFVRLRPRRLLWLGSAAVVVLLGVEGYLGGLIHDDGKDSLIALHVPLAMAILALAVWLTGRSARMARRRE